MTSHLRYGAFIRTHRQRRGLSEEALVDLARSSAPQVLGLQRNALRRWESGEALPNVAQAYAVTLALQLEAGSGARLAAGLDADTDRDEGASDVR